MISYHLGAKDLARVRFAFSPLQECVQSYRAMSMGPLARSLHTPWFARARRRLAGVDLEPMAVLVRSRHYIPDFLTPPPLAARAPLADEIERMVATPGDLVRQEVHETFGDEVPPAAMPYLTDTEGAVDRLATLLTVYWERAVAPDWPRIAALLERDVAAQAQVLALEGPEALFHRRLHPKMSWRGDTVMLEKETTCPDRTMDLDGQGLVLIPSVFSWPHVSTVINPAPPSIWYPAAGVAELWGPAETAAAPTLERLLGAGRAAVLQQLTGPASTAEIATTLHLTPSAVSQHLAVLHATGLADRQRSGRSVYYRLSGKGRALLTLFVDDNPVEGEVLAFVHPAAG